MTEVELPELVQRLTAGDDFVLQRFICEYRPSVRRAVREMVRPEYLDDCVQDTFFLFLRAVREGKFEYRGEPSLVAWLKQTARNAAKSYLKFLNRETSLVSRNRDGDEVEMEIAAPESGTQSVLFAGLLDGVLDSALIEGSESPEKHLKKLAFQMYYIDGLPMREITAHMARYQLLAQTGKEISQTTINNWLARGDILKLVVRYLVCHRAREVARWISDAIKITVLTDQEQEALHEWHAGGPNPSRGLEGQMPGDGDRILKDAREKVLVHLVSAIKSRLHDERRKS